MRPAKRLLRTLATIVLLLTVAGCDETTEVTKVVDPMDPTLQPGLDHALATTVRPVLTGLRVLDDLLSASVSGPGNAVCPDTATWCLKGVATCTTSSGFLLLNFDDCELSGDRWPTQLDGKVEVFPGSMLFLTSVNYSVDGVAISGEGHLNPADCRLGGRYQTSSARTNGEIKQCDSDPYPTGDFLCISFSYYSLCGNFDGTEIFPVNVSEGDEHVANCDVDLSTMKSTCQLVEL